MNTKLTESRIPGGFDFIQANFLGEAIVSDDGCLALISTLQSPIYISSEIIYYAFIDSERIDIDQIEWKATLSEAKEIELGNAINAMDIEDIDEETTLTESEIYTNIDQHMWNTYEVKFDVADNNMISVAPGQTGLLYVEAIFKTKGVEKSKLKLVQEISQYHDTLDFLICSNITDKKNAKKGALAGNLDASTRFIMNYRSFIYEAIKPCHGNFKPDINRVPGALLAACVFSDVITNENKKEHLRTNLLEMQINYGIKKTYSTETPTGICSIPPSAVTSILEFEKKQISDIYNVLRFPRTNFRAAAFVLSKLINENPNWNKLNEDQIINDSKTIKEIANVYRKATKLIGHQKSFGDNVVKIIDSPVIRTFFHTSKTRFQGNVRSNGIPIKKAKIRVYCSCKSLKIIGSNLKAYVLPSTTSNEIKNLSLKPYDSIPVVYTAYENWIMVYLVRDDGSEIVGWINIKNGKNHMAKIEEVTYLCSFNTDINGHFDCNIYEDKLDFENMNPWSDNQILNEVEKLKHKKYLNFYNKSYNSLKLYGLRIIKKGHFDYDTDWILPPAGLMSIEMKSSETNSHWIKESEILKYVKDFRSYTYTIVHDIKGYEKEIGTGDGTRKTISLKGLKVANHKTNCDEKVEIRATVKKSTKKVIIDFNGNCSGYCKSGKYDFKRNYFRKHIEWNAPPDKNSKITAKYSIEKSRKFKNKLPSPSYVPNVSLKRNSQIEPKSGYSFKMDVTNQGNFIDCCTFCAAVTLKAYSRHSSVNSSLSTSNWNYWINSKSFNLNSRLQVLDHALQSDIGDCIYAKNSVPSTFDLLGTAKTTPYKNNNKPQKWTLVQHYKYRNATYTNKKGEVKQIWASGHMFFILDYHEPTDKALILDTNGTYISHPSGKVRNGPQFQHYAHLENMFMGGKIIGSDWHKFMGRKWKGDLEKKPGILMIALKIYDQKLIAPTLQQ